MVKLRDNDKDAGKTEKVERLSSLDAVRGVFLLLIVTNGFGLKEMLNPERWGWITNQWTHREWRGCTLWDLLLPAMLFLVGVAMPYSYAKRQGKGQSWPRQLVHALVRAGVLILLGLYLKSYAKNELVFDLRGDLQQIGLAYLLAFLVLPLGLAAQGVAAALLLVGHATALVIYAVAGGHDLWSKEKNLGLAVDTWLRFAPQDGHVTLSVIPAAAIVLLGALIGGLIRSGMTPGHKVAIMTACSLVGILFGWLLSGGGGILDFEWYAVVPMIGRLMTLTFAMTSVGWTLLVFTYFYLVMDGFVLRAWAAPLAIVGRNALILYITYRLFREWAEKSAKLVLPPSVGTLRPLFVALLVAAIFWLLCFWLYRRRIFFKV